MTRLHYLGVATLTTVDQTPGSVSGFASLVLDSAGGRLTTLLPWATPGESVEVWLLVRPDSTRRLGELEIGHDHAAELSFEPRLGLLADLDGQVVLRFQSAEVPIAQGRLCPLTCGPQAEGHARLRPAGPASRTASGTVLLQADDATLTLELRGLPGPSSLGRTEPNGPPFEVYQVWVGQSKSGRKELLGELALRQGSHWSFHQTGAQAALRSDLIMVVPASRTGIRKTGPPILVGSLPSLQIADSV